MRLLDLFHRAEPAAALPAVDMQSVQIGQVSAFYDLDDPRLLEFMRSGGMTESGVTVSVKTALKNPTVLRCVSLVSFAIGYLPLHLRVKATKEKATDHPLFRLLHRKPNPWQTSFEFRVLMQQRALTHGSAYARIVWTRDVVRRQRVPQAMIPLDPERVAPRQRSDWQIEYVWTRPDGTQTVLAPDEVFHLRYGMSVDGITGLSLVKQSAEAIGLAIQTDKAAARLFRNGMIVGGVLAVKDKLSPEAYERLKAQMDEREGADRAHKWIVAEQGLEAKPFTANGRDSQRIETSKHQIEEIARPFGVPRPLLGVDDTSWGSGIDVLGQFFVRYGLNPWFTAWEQAIERSLLTDDEVDEYEAKFNEGALLRGSMKDQADFFSKALGAGGHQPWMDYEEVRETMDLPEREVAPNPMTSAKSAPTQENSDAV
ncbi:phage portal protein [Devosia beringensis]|uniref:phage portal protein n=1 Tax=Devosia beringensis TaxID=2657486 RepID=UPI001AED94A9|nr:phage portal protein [Devosia beringensis]